MLERIEDGEPIDIYSCVASLRTKRQDMVQTEVCMHALRKFGTWRLMSEFFVISVKDVIVMQGVVLVCLLYCRYACFIAFV